MRKPDINKELKTRTVIIAAAQKMLRQYGFDKTTMEDIARGACMGKSSLYYYYKSREEIFYAAAQKEMEELQKKVDRAVAKENTPSKKLRALILGRYHGIKSMMLLYSVLLKESTKYIDLFNRIQATSHKLEEDAITAIFEDGVKAGEFTGIQKKDIPSLAHMAMLLWRGMAANIIVTGEIPGKNMNIESIVDVFTRGLK